jgi:hypothetical protein
MRTSCFHPFKPERPRAPGEAFHHTMQAHFRAHADNYGVSPRTLISADVLNQYMGLITLFELFPGAPHTVAPHLFAWEARPYSDFFKATGHPAQDFLAAAGPYVPGDCHADFHTALQRLELTASRSVDALKSAMRHGRAHEARDLCRIGADTLRLRIEAAAAIASPPEDANVVSGWWDVTPERMAAGKD